jgi:MFS family permease
MQHASTGFKASLNTLVLVAALGYFVDIYDLILFGVVRVASLASLGIVDDILLKQVGEDLINWQMGGMLIGGLVWGILGDKRGRITVLFGSILLMALLMLIVLADSISKPTKYYDLWRALAWRASSARALPWLAKQ